MRGSELRDKIESLQLEMAELRYEKRLAVWCYDKLESAHRVLMKELHGDNVHICSKQDCGKWADGPGLCCKCLREQVDSLSCRLDELRRAK